MTAGQELENPTTTPIPWTLLTLLDVIKYVCDMGSDAAPPFAKRGGYAADIAEACALVCTQLRRDDAVLNAIVLRPRGSHDRTMLAYAVRCGDEARVAHILTLPCTRRGGSWDINAATHYHSGASLLFLACLSGRMGAVQLLISAGAKPNITSWCTVLKRMWKQSILAISAEHHQMVQEFVESYSITPTEHDLALTAYYGGVESTRFLLRTRHWSEDAMSTAMLLAVEGCKLEVVRLYLAAEVIHPLALSTSRDQDILVALTEAGCRFSAGCIVPDEYVLFNPDSLRAALSAGLDVNSRLGVNSRAPEHEGVTLLQKFCTLGYEEHVRFLISAGADVNVRDTEYGSAFYYTPIFDTCSTKASNTIIVKMILDAGGDPNAVTSRGLTPLSTSCSFSNVENVRLLLSAGANPGILIGGELSLESIVMQGRGSAADKAEVIAMLREATGAAAPADGS